MPGSDESTSAQIGCRIRAARVARGVSLREFARRLGVSAATLSATETGGTGISVDRLAAIADALGVAPGELLGMQSHTVESEMTTTTLDRSGPLPRWRFYEGPDVTDPVLAAALRCIVERGYHGCSIRDIAESAGLSIASLYHHHASKQAMLVALFDLAMTDLLDRVGGARDEAGDDPVRALRLMTESLVLYHSHRRRLSFLASTEMRSLVEPDRRRIADRRTSLQRMFDVEVENGAAQGLFLVARPREAARAVVGLCIAVADWFDPEGSSTPEDLATTYAGYALNLMDVRRP